MGSTETSESAKLSTETRNELPTEAFCGPDRSFPAHDAAHVRNGLARLSQSNLSPEEKAKVKGCLESRAKKYGIEVSSTTGEVVNVDGKSTQTEEVSVNNGETMSENAVSAIDHNKVVAELEVAKQAVADLQKFKDEVISKDKEATLGVIASYIDVTPFKDAPLCTLKAVASALDAQKKKLAEAPIKNSGAAVASTNETSKPTLPAGVKDEAHMARLREAAERAGKYGRTVKVE